MTEVFDSYNKKTSLYYTLQTISITTILSIAIAKITNFQFPNKYSPYLITSVILGLSTIVINMLLTATNIVKMYKKNGELTISNKFITVNSVIIPLIEVKKVLLSANDYKGARASDGSGNRIEVYNQSNKRYSCRFVISSSLQRESLMKILEEWNAVGVEVTKDGF